MYRTWENIRAMQVNPLYAASTWLRINSTATGEVTIAGALDDANHHTPYEAHKFYFRSICGPRAILRSNS